MSSMNAKTRFMRALQHQPVDRPPAAAVVTAVTVPMMERAGLGWPEAHSDADQLAELAASVWEYAGIECIKLPFCMTIEVETFGAHIDFGTYDTLPTEVGHIFNHPDELAVPEDFFALNRVPTVLNAIGKLHTRYKDEVAIIASIVGPFALAAKLFGFDNFFPWIINNPDYVHQIMEKLTPLAIDYATAQVEAGADAILIGEATCSGDLISANIYRDFIASYHTRICEAIPAATIMHICGKSTGHIPYLAATGMTAYSFDEGVDINLAREELKGKVALVGYVPTVEFMLNGAPGEVYQASIECLSRGVDILAPGCSLPQHTTMENIAAMKKAAVDWGASESLRNAPLPDVIAKPAASGSGGRKPRQRKRRPRRERV